ncbi:MAG TPA: C39 family peptidase [Pyrinomonadaceae bacterium]|nr:C39 family peptidase [Pyrinomonadaceae bacterium]
MPLRIQTGIRIWSPPPPAEPQSALPQEEEEEFLPLPQSFGPQPHTLDITRIGQERDNWCWAACVQMVMQFFDQDVSQCQVASRFFEDDACNDPDNSFDSAREAEEIEVVFANQLPSVTSLHRPGTITFERIQSEIDDDHRPVAVGILWLRPDGVPRGGHLVLVKGWRTFAGREFVKVNDPYYEDGDCSLSRLLHYYGPDDDNLDGVWRHTWTDIRR